MYPLSQRGLPHKVLARTETVAANMHDKIFIRWQLNFFSQEHELYEMAASTVAAY